MGLVEVNGLSYALPGGPTLFGDVSFRVGNGERVALVGANGSGKTTLLRVVAGEERPRAGSVRVDGELRFMRQLMGGAHDPTTVRELLLSLSPASVRAAAVELDAATAAAHGEPGERSGMRVARAHAAWGDAGGYDAEVLWDTCTIAALDRSFDDVAHRPLSTLSGGEQKRLSLEVILRCGADVVLLDEPDNFLDVPAKEWLEEQLVAAAKTILFVSHDRELLARTATKIVTIEGRGAWTHPDSFTTYHDARDDRLARIDEEHRRYAEERARLEATLREYRRRAQLSDKFASRVRSTKTKIERFEREAPPERAREQQITMRLGGDRTGKRAVTVTALELAGLTDPFDTEILFGERVGIIGHNGTGKSHFLKLLAGRTVEHEGEVVLGARVVPGYFSQVHDEHGAPTDATLLDRLQSLGRSRGEAMAALRRYELHGAWNQPFTTLSGGQQARFQILLLECAGATLLLLDEPTDNLDLASAEALEEALAQYTGTALIVTHDRWLMRSCDRFLVFGSDCTVNESLEPEYR